MGGGGLCQSASAGAADTPASAQSASPSAGAPFFPVLLTDDQAAACLGVSVRKFHELRGEPWMVRPVVLGPRLLRWPRAELERSILDMPRQPAPGVEPAQLLRARIERQKRTGAPA